jgi:heme-degrading monooxygenase HmoA
MAYTYHVEFTLGQNQMEQIQIGSALEKVLGYLRTLLPNEPGFISARCLHSLDIAGSSHIMVQSIWEQWDDLEAHRDSGLAEQKLLTEFAPHIMAEQLTVHVYEEVP